MAGVSYKTVVIAVDGSDEGVRVLEAADRYIDKVSTQLKIIVAVPALMREFAAVDPGSFESSWPVREMEAALESEIARSIRERVARFGIAPDRVTVRIGAPADEICDFCKENNADLVVLGSHPASKPNELGPTAHSVLRRAPCDVLAVRLESGRE